MEKTFIYVLLDPDTENIRYVGKSNFPKKRLYEHIYNCKKTHTYKNNWINLLLKENKKPILRIIDEVDIKDWQFYEKYWIEKLKNDGHNLTNIDKGDDICLYILNNEIFRKI